MKRLIYLAYYLKKMNWPRLRSFLNHTSNKYKVSKVSLIFKMVYNSLLYNISLLEYFQFDFISKSKSEKQSWAGTGYMYAFQLKMNPKDKRDILEDKIQFFEHFKEFTIRAFASIKDAINKNSKIEKVINNPTGKTVIKNSHGGCGIGLEILDNNTLDLDAILNKMQATENDLAESLIRQHDDLMELSPSGLNTIRIITQINAFNGVDIIGSRLRISVNSIVDNMAAGNMAAVIDSKTGVVTSKGFYSDITKHPEDNHPITGKSILGFQVPFWEQTIKMVSMAAIKAKDHCKSVGWDIGISNEGPEIVEGNHDWCKLVWQLPAEKGLKPELEKYIIE